MKAIRYTQQDGFHDVDFEGELGIKLPSSWPTAGHALVKAGWIDSPSADEEWGTYEARARVYGPKGDEYVVELSFLDRFEWVLVRGGANMMALRLALVPLFLLGLHEAADDRASEDR